MKMKKNTAWILFAAAALVLTAAAMVFGGGWIAARCSRGIPAAPPKAAMLVPETVADPGVPALAALDFELPWGNAVAAAEAIPGANTVISGPARVTSSWRWGYRIWRVEATVRPLASAETGPGRLLLTLEHGIPGAPDGRLEAAIPAVSVKTPSEAGAEKPLFAPPEEDTGGGANYWKYVLPAVVILLLAGYFAWWHLRVRRTGLASWDAALLELTALGAKMKKRGFRTEDGVAALSDILRRYLAIRFGLPAATSTGSGFLDAAGPDGPAPEDIEFLRSFFDRAELVKFARVPAETAELERAVAAAEAFVGRTVPPPPPRRGGRSETEVRA